MKSRQNPAPLTKEDGDIWARVLSRCRPHRCFDSRDASLYHRVTLGADRRDADLMWTVERVRITVRGFRPPSYPKWPMVMIMMRGDAADGVSWPNGEPL